MELLYRSAPVYRGTCAPTLPGSVGINIPILGPLLGGGAVTPSYRTKSGSGGNAAAASTCAFLFTPPPVYKTALASSFVDPGDPEVLDDEAVNEVYGE